MGKAHEVCQCWHPVWIPPTNSVEAVCVVTPACVCGELSTSWLRQGDRKLQVNLGNLGRSCQKN